MNLVRPTARLVDRDASLKASKPTLEVTVDRGLADEVRTVAASGPVDT
jgi:hypothetical protein